MQNFLETRFPRLPNHHKNDVILFFNTWFFIQHFSHFFTTYKIEKAPTINSRIIKYNISLKKNTNKIIMFTLYHLATIFSFPKATKTETERYNSA